MWFSSQVSWKHFLQDFLTMFWDKDDIIPKQHLETCFRGGQSECGLLWRIFWKLANLWDGDPSRSNTVVSWWRMLSSVFPPVLPLPLPLLLLLPLQLSLWLLRGKCFWLLRFSQERTWSCLNSRPQILSWSLVTFDWAAGGSDKIELMIRNTVLCFPLSLMLTYHPQTDEEERASDLPPHGLCSQSHLTTGLLPDVPAQDT